MKLFFSRPTQLRTFVALIVVTTALSLGTPSLRAQDDDPAAEAVALFNRGQDAHEQGDLTAAIDLYDKAIKLIPAFPEAELQRGSAFVTLGRLGEAESAFRKAVELRQDWSLALAALGDVLVKRAKYPEAERALAKAIELDEQNYPAYTALAELKLRTNAPPAEKSSLLDKLKVLTSKASPTAGIWAARGALENSLGDRTAAKTSLNAALQLEPKNLAALSESVAIALQENDPGRAAGYMTRLEAVSPLSPSVKLLRAQTLYASGDAEGALKVLTEIAQSLPAADSLRQEILAQTTADPTELEKRLAADPKNASVLGRLCSILRIKNPAKALEYCRLANAAEPTKIEHAIGFGAALIQAKRFDDAVSLFRRLMPSAPDNATIRANLATALFFSKRYAEAKVEYRWLTDHQPNLAAAYYFLAISHDQLGEYADAMANYQQFLRLADERSNLEIDKVNLRLPALQKQIRDGKGKRSN